MTRTGRATWRAGWSRKGDGMSRVTCGLPPRVAEAVRGFTGRIDKALRSSPRWRQAIRGVQSAPHLLRGHFNLGWCPICEATSLFVWTGAFLREHYRCLRCYSIPRWRAVIYVLGTLFPHWRDLTIHESSPGGAASQKLQAECKQYLPTHFWPGVAPGQSKYGVRSEDLERLTFPDESFDLVVTQDVFEHVLQPGKAFAEVARTLKPGGAHLFTVPTYPGRQSVVRAEPGLEGTRHLLPEAYHGNPISDEGSLVVTDWGDDLVDYVYEHSGLTTTVNLVRDRRLGLDGTMLKVFVSRKRPSSRSGGLTEHGSSGSR